jgi:hypothetical protein
MANADESRSFHKLREAWIAAVTSAEAELQKTTARLRQSLGLTSDTEGADVMSRVRKHREEFERKLEEGIHQAIARARAPIDRELASLKARVEALGGRLDALKRRRSDRKR